jgi:hypothetical protein
VTIAISHRLVVPMALTEREAFTFQAAQVRDAGFARCRAGHVHVAPDVRIIVSPDSPEPICWNETGPHCVALMSVTDAEASVETAPDQRSGRRVRRPQRL